MKKTILISTGVVIALAVVATVLISSKILKDNNQVKSVENEYAKILKKQEKKTENGDETEDSNAKSAKDYARIFRKIANGNPEDANEYSQLLAKITSEPLEIDDDVFSIAEDYAQLFEKISEGNMDFGIQQVKIVENNLVVDYIDIRGYSVRILDDKAETYYVNEDDSLGKYRIEIVFHEARGSEELSKIYPRGKIHELKDVPSALESKIKIAFAYPPDDSVFVIYIGSDEYIGIKEERYTKINRPIGSIKLAIEKSS